MSENGNCETCGTLLCMGNCSQPDTRPSAGSTLRTEMTDTETRKIIAHIVGLQDFIASRQNRDTVMEFELNGPRISQLYYDLDRLAYILFDNLSDHEKTY